MQNICSWIKCQCEQVGEEPCLLRCSPDGQRGSVLKAWFLLEPSGEVERWSEVETWAVSPHNTASSSVAASSAKQLVVFSILPIWCKIQHLDFVPANTICCLCRNVTNYHQPVKWFRSLVGRDCLIKHFRDRQKSHGNACFAFTLLQSRPTWSHDQFTSSAVSASSLKGGNSFFFKRIIKYNRYNNHYWKQRNIYKEALKLLLHLLPFTTL